MMFVNEMAKLKKVWADCESFAECTLAASVLFSVFQNRVFFNNED